MKYRIKQIGDTYFQIQRRHKWWPFYSNVPDCAVSSLAAARNFVLYLQRQSEEYPVYYES